MTQHKAVPASSAEEWVAEWIRQLVEAAPPLPPESLEVIRRLMRPTPDDLARAVQADDE